MLLFRPVLRASSHNPSGMNHNLSRQVLPRSIATAADRHTRPGFTRLSRALQEEIREEQRQAQSSDQGHQSPAAADQQPFRRIPARRRLKVAAIERLLVIESATKVNAWRRQAESTRKKVGLVPTMGALHEGHLSLIKKAAVDNDEIVVSIFVNPTQFGPTEDLATYPKTWAQDVGKIKALNRELKEAGRRGSVSVIFRPRIHTMYPGHKEREPLPTNLSYVTVDPQLTSILEGAARPTFFRGVTTVVMKLFWLLRPHNAYFGQKDVQQLAVINRMVRDFQIPVKIVPVPISRDSSGMALSSRNAYLGERRGQVALVLRRALRTSFSVLRRGETSRDEILGAALRVAADELKKQRGLPPHQRALFEVEYFSMAGFNDLRELEDAQGTEKKILSGTIVMLPLEETVASERLGVGDDRKPVRLLDNIVWSRSEQAASNTSENHGDGDENELEYGHLDEKSARSAPGSEVS